MVLCLFCYCWVWVVMVFVCVRLLLVLFFLCMFDCDSEFLEWVKWCVSDIVRIGVFYLDIGICIGSSGDVVC